MGYHLIFSWLHSSCNLAMINVENKKKAIVFGFLRGAAASFVFSQNGSFVGRLRLSVRVFVTSLFCVAVAAFFPFIHSVFVGLHIIN